ncbi:bifunctional homocysteine S-methyltransferase/methylenetetrahydrofolate reductase [Alkalihalophilus marmarensis]|jgi:homocysteine S-methyltransferase|uniref:5,10-methylenetetrahydrofolate reductase n=1 Tax=Alkalihalophilus marmarensis DSM 21297 TaxID=1188261 RepID=U6SR07_9BACI|nr:bifunctional homocysteine S-methyltransferase/methylenetetrahydrofolate reductase [Alkalihalophilus marmarensis]ERN54154.1 5,10-methylenetetrahydrofolate reductase [Alkalihalophilus marmarensis DSM 21297]MCM3488425.1 bifunctional homocysteine S-methyltransferase/methylenetetrahydrofolate reductase [Alkalihalophilus marmarensis]
MNFLEKMKNEVLVGDGAMGTLLYEQGISKCFEELNLSDPNRIIDAHKQYIEAGAVIIQTNTYAANRLKLEKYELDEKVKIINQEAVKLAREAGPNGIFIVGTVGGLQNFHQEEWTKEEVLEALEEQIEALLVSNVDGILLETFYDLEELLGAINIVRKQSELPIIANVSLGEIGVLHGGVSLKEAIGKLENAGADVVGINCRMGPSHMLRSLEDVPLPKRAYLSVYPNASLPEYQDGRLFYHSNPEYFESMGEQFVNQGVRLLGGCCGTTPEHIRAFSHVAERRTPVEEKWVTPSLKKVTKKIEFPRSLEPLSDIAKKRRSVIVELDPPKKLSTDKFIKGAKVLKEAGVDAVTLADNSLASPRIDNMALAAQIKEDVRPLVHVTCRDRNLIGLQSHLMGLHALGINDVLAVTGDPTKVGDFPGATSVYDVTSFQLISLMKQLNEGISFSGKDLGQKANFSIAAACNPNVRHMDKAVQRMEKKIESGADFFMTQPMYSEEQIEAFYHETKHLDTPVYVGIMPLTSSRNAEFLHNEVPGIKLTDSIRSSMASCETKESAQLEGIKIAKSLIDTATQYFNGIYLITPFLRYEITAELTAYIEQKSTAKLTH